MARISFPDQGMGEHVDWALLRPDMAVGMGALSDAVYSNTQLPLREREAARWTIALINDCVVCQDTRARDAAAADIDEGFYAEVADWRTSDGATERERLAAEFAERFALDHLAMDDDFWARLRARLRRRRARRPHHVLRHVPRPGPRAGRHRRPRPRRAHPRLGAVPIRHAAWRRASTRRGQAHVSRSCLAALGGPLGPRLASLDSELSAGPFEDLLAGGADRVALGRAAGHPRLAAQGGDGGPGDVRLGHGAGGDHDVSEPLVVAVVGGDRRLARPGVDLAHGRRGYRA